MSIKEKLKNSITLSDIEDYEKVGWEQLRIIIGNLGHEVRRHGKEAFMKLHTEHIDEFRRDWSHIHFCYLLGFMGTLDPSFNYDESVKTEKYVILESDRVLLEYQEITLQELLESCNESFLSRGFILETEE